MFNVRKAVQLAPGSADVAELASFILAPSGYPEEGLVPLQKAITLSPNHPPMYLGSLATPIVCQAKLMKRLPLSKFITLAVPVLVSSIL